MVNIFLTLRIENNFLNETKYTIQKEKQMLINLKNNYSPHSALPFKVLNPDSIPCCLPKVPCYQHTPLTKGTDVIYNSKVLWSIYF